MKSFNFLEYLQTSIDGYKGKNSSIIVNLPFIYQLLNALIKDDDLNHNLKSDIYIAFGYLFHSDDLYSEEEHGPLGFTDDLLLCLFVLKKISYCHGNELIAKYWLNEGYNIEYLIDRDFDLLKDEYPDLFIEVLRITGFVDESF
jgi:hypothetical protein